MNSNETISLMEYRCPKCGTFYPANEISIEEKQSGRVMCIDPNCGEMFNASYSGRSIYTVRNA